MTVNQLKKVEELENNSSVSEVKYRYAFFMEETHVAIQVINNNSTSFQGYITPEGKLNKTI